MVTHRINREGVLFQLGVEKLSVESHLERADPEIAFLVSDDLEVGKFFLQRLSQLLKLGPVVSLLTVFDVEFHREGLSRICGGQRGRPISGAS